MANPVQVGHGGKVRSAFLLTIKRAQITGIEIVMDPVDGDELDIQIE